MADLSDFIPIRTETLDWIIARMDADLNAGIGPDDDRYIDTTPGTFYADLRTALALELERLWDVATTDTAAASLVEFAWGEYLDAHGDTLNVSRNEAVKATGEVTFTGDNGTIIGTGTEVSTVQVEADDEAISFLTTEQGTISGGTLTLAVEAELAGAAGNVAANAVDLLMSPTTGVTAVNNTFAITGGADYEGDESYRARIKLAWSAAQGAGSVADYERWALDYDGVGHVRVTPIWNGPGTVRVMVTDIENNKVSDEVLNGLQATLDPYEAETTVDGNQTGIPATGATLTVTDTTDFRDDGKFYFGDTLVTYTGKSATTFTGCAGLPSTADDGDPVVQHGHGAGLAPVGAIVSVRTADADLITVALTLTLRDDYTLDGDTGTIAVRSEIETAISSYINELPPGGDPTPGTDTGTGSVLLYRVAGEVMRVPGVYNATVIQLDGAATDYAVAANAVPEMSTVTITVL